MNPDIVEDTNPAPTSSRAAESQHDDAGSESADSVETPPEILLPAEPNVEPSGASYFRKLEEVATNYPRDYRRPFRQFHQLKAGGYEATVSIVTIGDRAGDSKVIHHTVRAAGIKDAFKIAAESVHTQLGMHFLKVDRQRLAAEIASLTKGHEEQPRSDSETPPAPHCIAQPSSVSVPGSQSGYQSGSRSDSPFGVSEGKRITKGEQGRQRIAQKKVEKEKKKAREARVQQLKSRDKEMKRRLTEAEKKIVHHGVLERRLGRGLRDFRLRKKDYYHLGKEKKKAKTPGGNLSDSSSSQDPGSNGRGESIQGANSRMQSVRRETIEAEVVWVRSAERPRSQASSHDHRKPIHPSGVLRESNEETERKRLILISQRQRARAQSRVHTIRRQDPGIGPTRPSISTQAVSDLTDAGQLAQYTASLEACRSYAEAGAVPRNNLTASRGVLAHPSDVVFNLESENGQNMRREWDPVYEELLPAERAGELIWAGIDYWKDRCCDGHYASETSEFDIGELLADEYE